MHENTSRKHKLLCPVWSVSLTKPDEKEGGGTQKSEPTVCTSCHQFLPMWWWC